MDSDCLFFYQLKIRMCVWNELINRAEMGYLRKLLNLFDLVDSKDNESTTI